MDYCTVPGVDNGSSSTKLNSEAKKCGGGSSCCVTFCKNNTKRNTNLSFHKFPKDKTLRNTWIHWVGRHNFIPKDHHRVCSEHFPGGKKTYLNNVPTITPKKIKPTATKPRPTLKCRDRIFKEQNKENVTVCIAVEEPMKSQEEQLKSEISRLENELEELKLKYSSETTALKSDLQQSKFPINKFKNSDSDFEFYTGFKSYAKFKAFFSFLEPACTKLQYIGSNNGCLNSTQQEKRGRKRSLCPEEELFMVLSRLRCGLLERDIAIRYNISVSQVSNIWITWLDFLHQRLRSIPIWPSRELVNNSMSLSIKEHYPNTRVIIDCTEIFIEMPSAPASQSVTFSSYKHHNTAKALIGISPGGALTFVSELYAGRTSDKQLTKDCGILKLKA